MFYFPLAAREHAHAAAGWPHLLGAQLPLLGLAPILGAPASACKSKDLTTDFLPAVDRFPGNSRSDSELGSKSLSYAFS